MLELTPQEKAEILKRLADCKGLARKIINAAEKCEKSAKVQFDAFYRQTKYRKVC